MGGVQLLNTLKAVTAEIAIATTRSTNVAVAIPDRSPATLSILSAKLLSTSPTLFERSSNLSLNPSNPVDTS